MTRTMQDSDITSGFSPGADIYAAYVLSDTGEGHNNYAATVARFPGAKHLSICTRFNATAQCLDFEDGTTGTSSADAEQCVQWVQRMRAKGITPTVYVQLSLWTWLAGVFNAAGVVQPCWWIAHWTGAAHLEPGSDATQWQGGSQVDLSSVSVYWPTVDDGNSPSGGGTPIGDGDMTPDEHQMLVNCQTALQTLESQIIGPTATGGRNSAYTTDLTYDAVTSLQASVNQIPAEVVAGLPAATGGNIQPLLDAINALPAETVAALKEAL